MFSRFPAGIRQPGAHQEHGRSPGPGQAALLGALGEEKRKLERQMRSLEQQEMREREGRLASLSVRSKSAMECIVRYEAGLHRELHRSIRQLCRLQQRKGQGYPWGAPHKITKQSHRSHLESVT